MDLQDQGVIDIGCSRHMTSGMDMSQKGQKRSQNRQNQAREWKEHEKTEAKGIFDFNGPIHMWKEDQGLIFDDLKNDFDQGSRFKDGGASQRPR
ncbi:hypothetical protein Tco_1567243, partial [Tanacetum coccineum]